MRNELLIYSVDTLFSIEKARVALQGRLTHLNKRDKKNLEVHELYKEVQRLEDYITNIIAQHIKFHPAYHWFSRVKGVGNENIAKVVGLIDIERADHVSSLWKWFGYYPGAKRKKGEKLAFNIQGKSMCWRLGNNLMRSKGKFYKYYESEKDKFTERCINEGLKIKAQAKIKKKEEGVISKGHIHNYALRKMIKLFLACLWVTWREAEGLPVSEPYAHAKLGHKHIILPEDMIDKKAPAKKKAKILEKPIKKKRARSKE